MVDKSLCSIKNLIKHTVLTFFAGLYSPWKRGLNENTNRLAREYLSKA